jgi:hypothetical protein
MLSIIDRFLNKKQKKRILFGSFEYATDVEYLDYLRNITPEQSVLTLVAAAAYAQGKGIYSFEESESVMCSIRKLTMFNNKPEETPKP